MSWTQNNPPPVPLKRPPKAHEVRWLEQVAERAITTVYQRIESFKGNSLTTQHRLALRRIIVGFSYLAAGLIDARPAYSLDIGGGKTLSIEAFIEALRRLSTRMRQSGHEISVGAPPRSLGSWVD